MEQSDALYRRFLDGDEGAFGEIMEQFRPSLIFFIHRYIKDLDMAEDIAIDVFCQILMHPKRYNFKTELKTYLFLIAKSRAIDYLRKRDRFQWVDSESLKDELREEKELEEIVLENERKLAIQCALPSLPDEMRMVIHLIYFENLSYKEAAKVMGKSTKQVDNLLYRAKERLKETLGKEGEALL